MVKDMTGVGSFTRSEELVPWGEATKMRSKQSPTGHLLTFGEIWSWRTWHSGRSIQAAVMPKVRNLAMSWFWVVHLLWNKTPASSWSYQKQGPALKGRSLQELELSLAYVGYNNEAKGKVSILEPSELGFSADSSLNRMAGVQTMRTGNTVNRRRHRRIEIVPIPTQDSRFRTGN